MNDWDNVSSPAEDTGATDFKNAAPTLRPQRPPRERKAVSGSSIVIILLSIAVIGLLVLTGLSIFHIVKINNVNATASAPTQPLSGVLATVEAEATTYAAAQPRGVYSSTLGCPTTGGNFWIVNAKTGLVADVAGASKSSGAEVLQYPDDGGLNQIWQFTPAGNNFKIVNAYSSMLLDEPNGSQATGADIIQNPDNGASSQQWQCISTGSNHFKIVNASSGLALNVANTNLAQIAPLLQDSYTGGLNQQWLFVS